MRFSERGQTVLIMVLIMVIILTVGLAVAARTITNLRTTTEEENSERAFSAAEAGVEQALKEKRSLSEIKLDNNATIKKADFSSVSGAEIMTNSGTAINKDNGVDVWLSQYSEDASQIYTNPYSGSYLTIYWGLSQNPCSDAALELIFISGSKNSPLTKRFGFDACTSRSSSNKFDSSSVESGTYPIQGQNFYYRVELRPGSLPASPLIMRAIPIYTNTAIAVRGCDAGGGNCAALPSQGEIVESTGTFGETTRKVSYFKGYPALPSEFFSHVFFSPR